VVETNVHHPTDSALLSDGVRVLSRLLRRAKKVLSTEEIDRLPKEIFRTRNRSVRRVAQRLHRIARRKGEKARRELKEAYQKLITITQASCTQAKRVVGALRQQDDVGAGRLLEHFEHFLGLVEQGIAHRATFLCSVAPKKGSTE
jgi:transposase, IS5 family